MISVKEYAARTGLSKRAIHIACQQKQIDAIVLTHETRHTYYIKEEPNEKNNKKSN